MKVCVITGSRADYGLLYPIMNGLKYDKFFELQIMVTGAHMMEKFGSTYRMIVNDGFIINSYVAMNIENDTPENIVKCMGSELMQMSDELNKLKPDLVLVLGDRYEILIAVTACLIFKIPVGHFCGGNITEGAYDDNIRHAITKLSNIHFVTDKGSEKIVRQLGESNVIICGNPGLEEFYYFEPLPLNKLNINLYNKNMLVVFHPETLNNEPEMCVQKLRKALEKYDGHKFIFRSNADNDTDIIHNGLMGIDNATYIKSLERNIYLSLAYYCDIFIGNSSSGIFEIPLINKVAQKKNKKGPIIINIGERQKGRILANNIINCENYNDIDEAINKAENINGPFETYYEPMNTTDIVINTLKNFDKTTKKKFITQ